MKRYATGLVLYLLGLVVLSALLSPPVYWLVDTWFTDRWPFRRIFNRVLMVSALVLAWPLARYWGIRSWSALGMCVPWRRAGLAAVQGLALGVGCLALLAVISILAGVRDWAFVWNPGRLLGFFASGAAVGILEELLFRGVFFFAMVSAIQRRGALLVAVLGSLFFATAHFVKAGNVEGAVVWTAGWEVWCGMGGQLLVIQDVMARWSCLFLVGMVLCLLVLWQRHLWMAVGLHAGWVFGLKSVHLWTKPAADGGFWMPGDIMSGGVALLMLCGLAVWFWLAAGKTANEVKDGRYPT